MASPDLRIPLPDSFSTLKDILQLPLQSITVGFGDPRIRQANGSLVRTWNTERLYFQDTWRWRENLTLNYGLAWMMDGYKNYDLKKPDYLAMGETTIRTIFVRRFWARADLRPPEDNGRTSRRPSDWRGRPLTIKRP